MNFTKKIITDSVVGLILGGSMVYFAYLSISKATLLKFLPDDTIEQNIIFFVSLFLAPFFAIMLHELGHLLAGIFQGFRLELFVVGFLGIRRIENKIKVYFNTNYQYFGGVAATAPTKMLPDKDLIEKYKIILISGPLVSLFFGVIPFLFLFYSNSILNPFWGLLSVTSFGVFLATTIPNKTGIFFTDRKRYQRLNDSGETGKIELAFLQLVNQSILENHCKNLSQQNIQLLKTDLDKIIQFWGFYFEYQQHKDNNNKSEAETVKENLLVYKKLMPNGIWKSLEID